MEPEIDFYMTGIEDAAVAALTVVAGEYAGDIKPYSGELDSAEKLKTALAELAPRFPLFLVGYAGGEDERESQTSPVPGAPWFVRHDCHFIVIVVDENARGEDERRAGTYRMIADTHKALSHRQFVAVINEGQENEERITLNSGEFIPTDVERIAHLPDAAAYAVPFSTYFRYLSPDRSDPTQDIDSIEFTIDVTSITNPGNDAPGVHVAIKE